METTTAALNIRQSIRALSTGKITADDHRATMEQLRKQMSEQDYEQAKFLAAANDR